MGSVYHTLEEVPEDASPIEIAVALTHDLDPATFPLSASVADYQESAQAMYAHCKAAGEQHLVCLRRARRDLRSTFSVFVPQSADLVDNGIEIPLGTKIETATGNLIYTEVDGIRAYRILSAGHSLAAAADSAGQEAELLVVSNGFEHFIASLHVRPNQPHENCSRELRNPCTIDNRRSDLALIGVPADALAPETLRYASSAAEMRDKPPKVWTETSGQVPPASQAWMYGYRLGRPGVYGMHAAKLEGAPRFPAANQIGLWLPLEGNDGPDALSGTSGARLKYADLSGWFGIHTNSLPLDGAHFVYYNKAADLWPAIEELDRVLRNAER